MAVAMSQKELAKTVGYCHRSEISHIERGVHGVSPAKAKQLAEALKAPPREFLRAALEAREPEFFRAAFASLPRASVLGPYIERVTQRAHWSNCGHAEGAPLFEGGGL